MIIDWIYLIVLCIFLLRGYQKGLVIALFSVVALVIGVVGALKLSGTLAGSIFANNPVAAKWTPLLTYVLVFLILVWVIRLCAKAIQKSLELVALGWINRFAGALLYGFFISFIFSVFLWILFKMNLFDQETLSRSKVFPILGPLAQKTFGLVSYVFPFVKSAFGDLDLFFEQINQKLS